MLWNSVDNEKSIYKVCQRPNGLEDNVTASSPGCSPRNSLTINMAVTTPANGFVATARKVYHPIGFSKGYNFVLFFIFAGALMGFTLARLQYIGIDGTCSNGGSNRPLDCYYYTEGSLDRVGILLHLAAILPAAFLACLQFVPVIRRSFVFFHRINGYLIILLSLVSTAGALMLGKNAVGGWMEVQTGVGVLSLAFVISLALAWYNVKRLQIEQHRAWMLRAWFYVSFSLLIILNVNPDIMCTRLAPLSPCESFSSSQH